VLLEPREVRVVFVNVVLLTLLSVTGVSIGGNPDVPVEIKADVASSLCR
jgi:hypothetical protein